MKSFIFSIFFTAFTSLVFAQKPMRNSGAEEETQPSFTVPLNNTWLAGFEKRQIKMIQLLGLNDNQKHSLDTLNDRYVTQRAILYEDKSLNMRTKLSKTEILRRERDTKFKSILNAEQLLKWNDLRKAQQKKAFRKK